MAETPNPPPPSDATSSHRRHGCLTALMVMIGLVMLLPGLCVVITAITTLPSVVMVGIDGITGQRPSNPYFWSIIGGWAVFWLVCLGIGWLGVMLIRSASR
jgi:hypothetical protein